MSKEHKIKEAILEAARTGARLAIIGELSKLYERLSSEGKINQSRIAERLGVTRQHISRLLSGPGSNNWTINKIGELLAAMDAEIARVDMKPSDEVLPSNEFHAWLEKNFKWDVKHRQLQDSESPTQATAIPLDTEKPLAPKVKVNRLSTPLYSIRTSG
jgi:predicted XRE-type DNA-binding protein